MALAPGTRLGVYEIIALIGEGGMGQVFRARDVKLDRNVAIKILPEAFAHDVDRLARFQREAKTLASLNHPHIAGIHGLVESAGVTALAMELVEGEDLSQRIARGPIPLDEALPIAKQIAEALEAAHEQGIIHRDLKPANIKVRADGTVKVLDFGLAKAMEPAAGSSSSMSVSPTLSIHATQAGLILGTAAYMSPEQARGKTVDKRADIWAFGAVLFEMLTGSPPFPGEDISHVLARVIERDPDWATLPATISPAVATCLRRCLVKDPRQRMRDIGDVRLALDGAFETVATQSTTPMVRPTSALARALPWVASTAALLFAIAWLIQWAPWRMETTADAPLVRLDVDLGEDVSLPAPGSGAASSVAISPDGTRVVYASGTPPKVFIRPLDRPRATELPGTQGTVAPFFSPDGKWVGLVSGGKASRISVEGGAVVPIAGATNVTGAGGRWGDDGSLFIVSGAKVLRIPDGGGPPESIAEIHDGELGFGTPEPLPGGKAILIAADNPGPVDRTTIELVTLADRQRKTLIQGGASPRYLATANGIGHLVYVNQATLFAIPFDLNTLTTRGTAVPVVDDVAREVLTGSGQFDVSRNGTLVYRRNTDAAVALTTLQWVDATGKKEPFPFRPQFYIDPSLSPDGKRIALIVDDGGNRDVWVYDSQRDAMTRLTFDGATYRNPTWSPDGKYLVFASVGNGLFAARADGASQPQRLNDSRAAQYPRSFTRDGKRLAYYEQTSGGSQLWTVPLADEGGQLKAGTAEPFLKSSSNDRFPSFSPDGRWLAYESNESGASEVYVRAFPSSASVPGGKWQISTSGGTLPKWSPNGRDLLYRSGDRIMATAYTVTADTFVADKPRVWADNLSGTAVNAQWDLTPDGKRALVLTPTGSASEPRPDHAIVFVQNFFDELRRRVPLQN